MKLKKKIGEKKTEYIFPQIEDTNKIIIPKN